LAQWFWRRSLKCEKLKIPPISTKKTTTSHLKSMNIKKNMAQKCGRGKQFKQTIQRSSQYQSCRVNPFLVRNIFAKLGSNWPSGFGEEA
jgi:hypothetical protein